MRMIAAAKQLSSFYRKMINCLPIETIVYGFGYGSAVFEQTGEIKKDKMVHTYAIYAFQLTVYYI